MSVYIGGVCINLMYIKIRWYCTSAYLCDSFTAAHNLAILPGLVLTKEGAVSVYILLCI